LGFSSGIWLGKAVGKKQELLSKRKVSADMGIDKEKVKAKRLLNR
jgi:hypothetical protein